MLNCTPEKKDIAYKLIDNCILNIRNKGYTAFGTFLSFLTKDDSAYKALKTCRRIIDFSVFNSISIVITEDEYFQYTESIPKFFVSEYISGKQILNLISTKDASTVDSYLNEGFNKMLSNNQLIKPERLHLDLVKELFFIANECKNLDIVALEEAVRPIVFPRSREMVL